LVAGGTGSGKSVWLRAAVLSLVLGFAPRDLEVLLVDPKAVDYAPFSAVPHLRGGHIITEPEEAIEQLREVTGPELARRTQLLQGAGCSNFRELRTRHPDSGARYLVVVVDEYADLGLTLGKTERAEFERQILRLAQRGRSAGIFLILATQRPSVDFITGAVKANFSTRVSFRLPQRVDSQVILDEPGAEDLLGAGDLLLLHEARLQRLQGYFASTEEITKLIDDRITKRGFNDEAQH
jgi:DNA segregation ATPase FtsK/SpoIIIE-like protein